MKTDLFQSAGGWHFFFIYFNVNDPRIIVPKRFRKLGWTINFARPMAIPALLLMIAILIAPFHILAHYGIDSGGSYGATVLIEIIALVLFCSWRSNPSRYLKVNSRPDPRAK